LKKYKLNEDKEREKEKKKEKKNERKRRRKTETEVGRVSCLSQRGTEEKVLEASMNLSSILLGPSQCNTHYETKQNKTQHKIVRKKVLFFVQFNAQST
jgi:hypothetical protein